MMMSKTKKGYIKKSIFFNLFSIIFITILQILFFKFISLEDINNDFHYNIITLSATLAGFLFTGLSILISVIDKNSIEHYWKMNYLDGLCINAFIGIIVFVITIVLAVIFVLFDIFEFRNYLIFKVQIGLIWIGIADFLYCIKELVFIVKELKQDNS